QFQQEAVAADRVKNAAGPGRSFDKKNFEARFLKRIRANQPRNAAANHQSLGVTGHDEVCTLRAQRVFEKSGLAASCCFSRYGSKTMARLRMKMRPSPVARISPFSRSTSPSDRKSTRLNSSHLVISYAVFCLKKK